MIHYKDMTFCIARCNNRECIRKYTSDVRQAAVEWWGNDDAPVSIADLSDGCPDLQIDGKETDKRTMMKQYHQAEVKFNNGEGALLCCCCRGIIAYGFDHEDKMHICDHCKLEFTPEEDNE